MGDWSNAVYAAIKRQITKNGNPFFTRQELIAFELSRIVEEVGSVGITPEQTLSRELQELADEGKIVFIDNKGTYCAPEQDDAFSVIERVTAEYHIDGFRSLRNFSVYFKSGINALVGPNGAGKTNFIDFLEFLSTLISRDASAAVSVSGGVSRVFSIENSKKNSPTVTARISGTADLYGAITTPLRKNLFDFEYQIEIKFSKSHSSIYISSEKIRIFSLYGKDEYLARRRLIGSISVKRKTPSTDVEPIIEFSPKLLTTAIRNPLRYTRRTTASGAPRQARLDIDLTTSNAPPPDESILNVYPGRPALEAIKIAISRGRAFNFTPAKAREPDELSRPPVIAMDGAGLSAAIYQMQQLKRGGPTPYSARYRRFGPSTLDIVIQWTQLVLPELQDITAVADPHTGKYLGFLTVGEGEKTIRIPLHAASDGTLKWLTFVSMILVTGSTYSIEEPENYLHPKMQQFLIELIRETMDGEETNYFLISTHSETIINQLKPSELIIFEFLNGSTSCHRLENPQSVENEINETGFGLGYFYASNAVS